MAESALEKVKRMAAARDKEKKSAEAPVVQTAQPATQPAPEPQPQPVQAVPQVAPQPQPEVLAQPNAIIGVTPNMPVKFNPDAIIPTNAQEAANVLGFLLGGQADMDLSETVASVDQGGMAFGLPIARLQQGNWNVPKNTVDQTKYEHMPAGNRPFYAVYLAYRIGATAWKGAPKPGSGAAPVFRLAVPHKLVAGADAEALIQKVLGVGSRVQFTKNELRTKFDPVGRLIPEIHILVWTPGTGLICLVNNGYSGVRDTIEAMKEHSNKMGVPFKFVPEKDTVVNRKVAANAANSSWDVYHIAASVALDEKGSALLKSFNQFKNQDQLEFCKAYTRFLTAADYEGLRGDALKNKLAEYDKIS